MASNEGSDATPPKKEQEKADFKAAMTICVRNFPYDTSDDEIRKLFEDYGPVLAVRTATDRRGRFRGTAFVVMKNPDDGLKVIEELNGQRFNGNTLSVEKAKRAYEPDYKPLDRSDYRDRDRDYDDYRDRYYGYRDRGRRYDRYDRDRDHDRDRDRRYDDDRDRRRRYDDYDDGYRDRERRYDRDRDRGRGRDRDRDRYDDYRDRDRYDDRDRDRGRDRDVDGDRDRDRNRDRDRSRDRDGRYD